MSGSERILKISAGEVQAMIRAQMETQWGNDVEKDYPNLASFLSSPPKNATSERIRHLDAEGMKRQFFQTCTTGFKTWRHGPLVIFFRRCAVG
jgi:hypothetical protein